MKERNELHVVVGASGATGRVVTRELAALEKRVRAVNRSSHAPRPRRGRDARSRRDRPREHARAPRGAAVVYDCAMLWALVTYTSRLFRANAWKS